MISIAATQTPLTGAVYQRVAQIEARGLEILWINLEAGIIEYKIGQFPYRDVVTVDAAGTVTITAS